MCPHHVVVSEVILLKIMSNVRCGQKYFLDFVAIFITESNDIVVLAEGAFELNKIISSRGRFFPEDILKIRHLAPFFFF